MKNSLTGVFCLPFSTKGYDVRDMDIRLRNRKVIRALVIVCVVYPLWVIGIELGVQKWYFTPMCESYAKMHELTFRTYARGGRSSPPSCVMVQRTIPVKDIGGTTAQVMYVGTDVVAVIFPFSLLLIL